MSTKLPIGRVKLSNVRLAFPKLWTAEQINGQGKPKFTAAFLMPPGHPGIKEIERVAMLVAREKWADKAEANFKALKLGGKFCLYNGDAKPNLAGYPGNFFVNASSEVRPTVVERDGTTPVVEGGSVYSGCYVNAGIDLWAQDHQQHGKRINAALAWVQAYRDGDRFGPGAAVIAQGEIEDLGVEDENDALV